MQKRPSITRLYRKIAIAMIVVILFALFLSYYIQQGITRQVLDIAHTKIERQIGQLQEMCQNTSQALLILLTENEDVAILKTSDNPYRRNQANRSLQDKFQELRNYFLGDYHFFFYGKEEKAFGERDLLILPTPPSMEASRLSAVKKALVTYMQRNPETLVSSDKKWKLLKVEEDWIIVKIYRSQTVCLGCFFTWDSLEKSFGANEYNQVKQYLMLEEQGKVVTEQKQYARLTGTERLLVNARNRFLLQKNYEIAWYPFEKGNFSFVFLINILEKYQDVKKLLFLLCSLLSLLFLAGIWLLFYIRRRLFRPMAGFVKNLSLEELERVKTPYFAELAEVDQMFRQARKQIEKLKIEIYERELERQRIELEYLQLQIKPHFYLNCMNIIYNMAHSGKTEEIKRLSFALSGHLRSMFRQGNTPVTLQEELGHVEEYLKINAIRYEGELEWSIEAGEAERECRIAPLLIHTLVENSVKHALLSQQVLKLSLTAVREEREGEKLLYLRVADNGIGFPEEVLQYLKEGKSLVTEEGKRVGLSNTLRRLAYFYQGRAEMVCSNLPEGGALTELYLPWQREEA